MLWTGHCVYVYYLYYIDVSIENVNGTDWIKGRAEEEGGFNKLSH